MNRPYIILTIMCLLGCCVSMLTITMTGARAMSPAPGCLTPVAQEQISASKPKRFGIAIPFEYDRLSAPNVIVKASINGLPPRRFIVDTGASLPVMLDMYAGVEHLGRATVDFVDAMIVVVEPTRRSLGTAAQIRKLAADIGLKRLWLVGNKVRNEDEAGFLLAEAPGMPVLGMLPADLAVQEADRLGIAVYDHVPALRQAAEQIAQNLLK